MREHFKTNSGFNFFFFFGSGSELAKSWRRMWLRIRLILIQWYTRIVDVIERLPDGQLVERVPENPVDPVGSQLNLAPA